ncbi:hypothetical protein [uncultured Pedobacter sp.]|uniref:TlpA family protein disulfide reductase n=1 Tax=uncultured Pedobacter sp. TaxID=246139 RepID=UPI0025CCE7A2|nr:hypothetical protein [uncultured Pedobacter sp.]
MADYLSVKNVNSLVDEYAKLLYHDHPNLDHSNLMFKKLRKITENNFLGQLSYRLKYLYKNSTNVLLKKSIHQCVINLLNNACMQKNETVDPLMLGKYLGMYNFFKDLNYNEHEIHSKFESCDTIVRQYVLLNLLKDNLLPHNSKKEYTLSQITYPPFKAYAIGLSKNPNMGSEKAGYVNNTIKNIGIFDTKDQKKFFGDLFKSTEQPFIIFDFCGTWCKPCMDEIQRYKQTKNLDRSTKIRPIWLFFENDKGKWLEVVKQNSLIAENCFVILGSDANILTKEFALLADWQGEFPHHFVFSKEGKVIQKNAVNLSVFSENELVPYTRNEKNNSSTPALPSKW